MKRSLSIYGQYVRSSFDTNSSRVMLIPDIEMSAEIENDAPGAGNILTTNFDTYTLILQLVRP